MKKRIWAAGLSVAAALSSSVLLAPPAEALFDGLGDTAKWKLSLSESFSQGSVPDPAVWTRRLGNDGRGLDGDWNSGTQERQFYTGASQIPGYFTGSDSDNTLIVDDPAAADGKALRMTLSRNSDSRFQCSYRPKNAGPGTCAFTSAFIRTHKQELYSPYGRLETRVKLPGGVGLLPSFWAQGDGDWPKSQEIDVFESEDEQYSWCTTVCGSVHGPNRQHFGAGAQPGGWASPMDAGNAKPAPAFGANPYFNDINSIDVLKSGYHTLAADWYPDRIEYSIDNRIYNIIRKTEVPQGAWVFDQPFYIQLNIAAKKHGQEVPDPESAPGPWSMYVDHVKIYTPKDADHRSQLAQVGHLRSPDPAGSPAKCVDAVWGSSAPGTKLQLLTCKSAYAQDDAFKSTTNTAQYWSHQPDGTIRSNMDFKVCVTSGAEVSLRPCDGSAGQTWKPDVKGRVLSNSDACLSTQGRKRDDNTLLVTEPCDDSTIQKWSLPIQPYAEWPMHDFDKTPVTTVTDSTGGKRDATCTGVTWGNDWDLRGLVGILNGTTSACQTAGAVLDTSKDFTVSAWAKLDNPDRAGSFSVASQAGIQVSAFYLGYDGGEKKWHFKVPTSDSTTPTAFPSAKSTANGNAAWTHLTGVYEAETKEISLYVNGQLQQTTKLPTALWEAVNPTMIGRATWAATPADFFPGQISDVRIWKTALAAPTVKTLHDDDVFKTNIKLPDAYQVQ